MAYVIDSKGFKKIKNRTCGLRHSSISIPSTTSCVLPFNTGNMPSSNSSHRDCTHWDDVATQAVGCICTLNDGAQLRIANPCLLAGGAHRAWRGRRRETGNSSFKYCWVFMWQMNVDCMVANMNSYQQRKRNVNKVGNRNIPTLKYKYRKCS